MIDHTVDLVLQCTNITLPMFCEPLVSAFKVSYKNVKGIMSFRYTDVLLSAWPMFKDVFVMFTSLKKGWAPSTILNFIFLKFNFDLFVKSLAQLYLTTKIRVWKLNICLSKYKIQFLILPYILLHVHVSPCWDPL